LGVSEGYWLAAEQLAEADRLIECSLGARFRLYLAAQQAVVADRFAREIGAILELSSTARSRQLNGNALGGQKNAGYNSQERYD
jgi:hypothetical protein